MMIPMIPRTRTRHFRGQIFYLIKALVSGARATDVGVFEHLVAQMAGTKYASSFASGRSALTALLDALDYPPQSTVLLPSLNYPAVPRTVAAAGLLIHWIPVSREGLRPDFDAVDTAVIQEAVAVIWPHYYGIPAPAQEIARFCRLNDIDYIEDSAHALGARVGGAPVGGFGRAGIFSFETSKPVNTFGGGVIVTNDEFLADRLTAIRDSLAAPAAGDILRHIIKSYIEAFATNPWIYSIFVRAAISGAKRDCRSDFLEESADAPQPRPAAALSALQAGAGVRRLAGYMRELPGKRRRWKAVQGLLDAAELSVALDADSEPNGYMTVAVHSDARAVARAFFSRGVDVKMGYMKDCHLICEGGGADLCNSLENELFHLPPGTDLSPSAFEKYLSLIGDTLRDV